MSETFLFTKTYKFASMHLAIQTNEENYYDMKKSWRPPIFWVFVFLAGVMAIKTITEITSRHFDGAIANGIICLAIAALAWRLPMLLRPVSANPPPQ